MFTFHNLSLYFIEKIEVIHKVCMYHPQSKPHNFLPLDDMAFLYCLKKSLSEAQSTSLGINHPKNNPFISLPYLAKPDFYMEWNTRQASILQYASTQSRKKEKTLSFHYTPPFFHSPIRLHYQ